MKKRSALPIVNMVLAGLCAVLWFYRILIRGENDPLVIVCGIVWVICAAVWCFRTYRTKWEEEDRE